MTSQEEVSYHPPATTPLPLFWGWSHNPFTPEAAIHPCTHKRRSRSLISLACKFFGERAASGSVCPAFSIIKSCSLLQHQVLLNASSFIASPSSFPTPQSCAAGKTSYFPWKLLYFYKQSTQLRPRKCLGHFVTKLAQPEFEAYNWPTSFFFFFSLIKVSHQLGAMHGCNFHPDRLDTSPCATSMREQQESWQSSCQLCDNDPLCIALKAVESACYSALRGRLDFHLYS